MAVTELRRELREPVESREFIISDLKILGWYIRQIGLLETQIAEIREAERQEIGEIQLRADTLVNRCESSIKFLRERYEPQAQAFVALETQGTKRRSVPTLWGTAGFRKTRDALEIVNMEQAVEFAESTGLEVKVKKYVNKTPLLDHMRRTGEIPPGTEYVPGEDRFYTSYSRPADDLFEDEPL